MLNTTSDSIYVRRSPKVLIRYERKPVFDACVILVCLGLIDFHEPPVDDCEPSVDDCEISIDCSEPQPETRQSYDANYLDLKEGLRRTDLIHGRPNHSNSVWPATRRHPNR